MAENKDPPLRPPFPIAISTSLASLQDAVTATTPTVRIDGIQPQTRPQPAAPVRKRALESLPTIARKNHHIFLVEDDIDTYLKQNFDLSRLNRIHHFLWMAGRPLSARPLHRQKMMGFEVLHTEQVDLHLLKFSTRLLIKPLPDYILNYEFWETHLCESKDLHQSACGFLLSYIWLICSPLDLKLAHKLHLVPSYITWPWWKTFVTDFVSNIDVNALDQVNKRYHFGELRLGRINTTYRMRFMFTHFVRGYLYGYNRYVVFFQRNFGWVLIVFAFFSLVLSAMQVGVAVRPLNDDLTFQRASYGFVVFAITSVAALLGFVGITFVIIFLFNMAAAISHEKSERLNREKLADERKRTKGA